MAKTVGIDVDGINDVRSVTFRVADKKGGPSQILKRSVTKLVLLVENEFDSPSDGAMTKWTKWELFCDESDVVDLMLYNFITDFRGMIKLYLVMSCHSLSDMHLNHTSFVL